MAPWEKAKKALKRLGQSVKNVIIHHDQDGVFIGHRWVHEILVKSKARLSYSEDGARENVPIASFNGRFKQENRDLFWDQESIGSLKKIVERRIRYYDFERRHSALSNKAPMTYFKERAK